MLKKSVRQPESRFEKLVSLGSIATLAFAPAAGQVIAAATFSNWRF
jgi:hypothetical protein